jgi:arylsulfatase A-like enzyme
MTAAPNILWILTDQQSAVAMSCAGNPDLRTPAMDRLASQGVRFESAYCAQPLCTPARASLFTGLMPRECGCPRNGQAIREEMRPRELGRLLAAAGYDCYYGGKWHVPQIAMPEENDHGFHVICGFNDARLADASLGCLARIAAQPPEQRRPFFLVASFDNPHNICEWARSMPLPWGSIGEPLPPAECPNLPANFMPSPFEPEILRVEQAANWGVYPYRQRSPEDWRQLRWAYFRLVEKVDAEIGRILDALDARGLADNTVVVFSSDHGDGHGAHQWNQKSALFEEVVRVPLVLRAGGARRGIVDRSHLVSTGLDLLPTLCDYAGVTPPAGLRGRSLRPLLETAAEPATPWRKALFIETVFDGVRGFEAQGRAVRTARYKYSAYDRGRYREQLVDLEADPGELQNLAVERRHAEVLTEHRRLLATHLRTTADTFRAPA